MNEQDNPHAPPSSAEEAAALLGASISSTDAPPPSISHPNPPPGMHSIFAVQSPIPGGILFVRLCNLRDWLRWHAGGVDDSPLQQSIDMTFPKVDAEREPFAAARSILAVLMKLLEVSSNMGSREDDTAKGALVTLTSPNPRKHKQFTPPKPSKQHKALPPLLSTPLRSVWVDCVTLCISLGSSLPGNQRTDVYAFLTKMMDIANWNPRSKMASGGVRLAALNVIQKVCTLNEEMAKRSAPYALEILACCHRGLMSGGTGEPGHRAECVRVACGLMIGCRRASRSSGSGKSFIAPGALEERAAVEAIKFMKRAASDKYPEVRMAAATFCGLVAPMLIRNTMSLSRKDGEGVSPLGLLEDVTQVAMKNLDDESAGVATSWAASLARCLCASAEYGKSVRNAQSEDQANKRSADVDDEDIVTDINNLDFAGKFKAFSEARRATATTSVCSSELGAVKFLVSHFVKCGGESSSNKCGGSFSVGGRASRVGYSSALTEFLRLQAAKGDLSLGEALPLVLDMVGSSFEKQINRTDHLRNSSSAEMDLFAPASPYSSPEKKSTSALSATFLNKNSKAKSSADSTIGRLLTSRVIRKGISENLSELSQLAVLREITVSCRASVAPTAPDGSSYATRPINTENGKILNRHQLQVTLVEISHLITALGEASAASLEEITPVLKDCLAHRDHGVRLEAATVYAAVAQAFPTEGRKFVIESLSGFAANIDAIRTLSSRVAAEAPTTPKGGRFRRGAQVQEDDSPGSWLSEELMQHQFHMHGNALAVSMLMHEFPHVVGGIARVIVDKTFDVCEKLIQCQSDEAFVNANSSAVCTCVRAGYCMLSGIFTMVDNVIPHVISIFGLWQSSSMNVLPGVSKQSPSHDLLCVESMLSSVVSFLKFCPTILLSVPDALNRITSLLEKIFPLLSSGGRFDNEGGTAIGSARLSNARSAVMESYSWLPPGSFPLSADRIFAFAAKQIQELSGNEVICSILNSLVSREDDLIDAHSFERAVSPGQVGNSAMLDDVISIRCCDIVTTYERETTLHLISWRKTDQGPIKSERHHESSILGLLLRESDDNSKPTPLHEVGTWKAPLDPIPTAKVRLLDSSIHVFAATFGLQDPHTQSDALRMLEGLYYSTQTEKSNRFAVNTALITDSQGKVRPLEEDAIAFNVTAVILACLQAIPLHESTYGNLIGKGPLWMERATNLLLQLIPSTSDVIRRGAAEGLSYLATLGVSEDAHTLQSTILHSLDEVMQGNNVVANQKTSTDFVSFGRAGSLSSLACIQRTSKRMGLTMKNRATSRSVSQTDSKQSENDAPPVLIMITRLLPSLATHSPELDSCLVRCHAIHAFGVLLSNSFPDPTEPLSPEHTQIAWKAVEAIESSFLGAWSAVVLDNNKGREKEKFAWEPALAASIFRLMTTLLPRLSYLIDVDRWIASRFSSYATAILECCSHPVVRFEGSVFFECLGAHQNLVHLANCTVSRTNNTVSMALPFLLSAISPCSPSVVADSIEDLTICSSTVVQRSVVMCASKLCSALDRFPHAVRSALFLFLHDVCGRRYFQHISDFRSLAQSHMSFDQFNNVQLLEADVVRLIHAVLNSQASGGRSEVLVLQWLLCCRCVVSGGSGKSGQHEDIDSMTSPIDRIVCQFRSIAQSEASRALSSSSPPRWQLKCVASNLAFVALKKLVDMDEGKSLEKSMFNIMWAKSQCSDMLKKGSADELVPFPAFYMEELVLTACSAAAATSNHSELLSVQISGIRLLTALFSAFGNMREHDGTPVLEQYSSQIISAVKHSLKSEMPSEESTSSGFHRLFAAGCDALLALIKNDFIADPVALKRMLKPVMLSEDDTIFVKYPTEQSYGFKSLVISPHCVTDDLPSYPSFRLSKLCFAAELSLLVAYGEINESVAATLTQETGNGEERKAIHSAAAAIDGYLLMTGSENSSGLTFKNRTDLDIQGLVENWSTLCASALMSLIKTIKATDDNSVRIKSLGEWLEKLAPVAFSGLKSSLSSSSSTKTTAQHAPSCIYSIRLLIQNSACIGNNILCPSELSDVLDIVTQSVIFPALGLLEIKSCATNIDPLLIMQSCGLLEDISLQISMLDSSSFILHRAIVQPLASYQEGKFTLEGGNDEIMSSCIRSSISLMQSSSENERVMLEKALLQFATHTLTKLNSNDQRTHAEVECVSLLRACLENTVLSQKELSQIVSFTAANELWDAWYVLSCELPAGVAIECCILLFKKALGNLGTSAQRHAKALGVFRNGLQTAMGEKPTLVGTVLHTLGFEIFQLFRFYSMNMSAEPDIADNRLLLCAECVKMIMMAYQYHASTSTDESKFVGFLVTLFTLLVESVSFNGLPNHSSGKPGADDKIGKMCAQVFVHIARTTPPMFKSTMTVVIPECRSTIEAAVRADMSGYAAAHGPAKKKLSLKGFVK